MGRTGYGIVTSRRWLLPFVRFGEALLFAVREAVLKHEARHGHH